MDWKLPAQVDAALTRLEAAGFEAYVVGGCVRDNLMGRVPKDYDITTSALPEQTASVFAGAQIIETGMKHGTVTVLLDGEPLEITTFRIDGTYSDSRHPDAVIFTPSLTEDLARRDLTINAMAYSPRAGLADPFGGRADLTAQIIRCVGAPERRFREDALRILRALRFASVLGFRVEPETADALQAEAPLLKNVSVERVFSELKQLLCGKNVRRVLLDYVDVLGTVLPELLPLRGFDQRNPHHCYDILEHTAAAAEAIPPIPALRLAALLHDVGKPRCFCTDADGVGHFYGHPKAGAQIAETVLDRLRSDKATRERVTALVLHHDLLIEDNEKSVGRALRRLGPPLFNDLLSLKRADNFGQAPEFRWRQTYYDRLAGIADDILAANACLSLKDLAVKGSDLGLPPGPEVGKTLNFLLDAVIDGQVPNTREALLAYLRSHQKK